MPGKKQAGPKMTIPVQLVLRAMLAEPTQEMYGLQVCQAAGLPSGPSTRSWPGWRAWAGWNPAGRTPCPRKRAGPAAATTS